MKRVLFLGVCAALVFAYGVAVGAYQLFPFDLIRDGKALIVATGQANVEIAPVKAAAPTPKQPAKIDIPSVDFDVLDTTLVQFRMERTNRGNPAGATGSGGAIEVLAPDRFLLVDRLGRFLLLNRKGEAQALEIAVDRNYEAFYALRSETDPERFNRLIVYFRAFDVAVRPRGENQTDIFVSFNYWHPDKRCKTTRLATATVGREELIVGSATVAPDEWRIIFESRPCLALGDPATVGPEAPIRSNRTGGKIAFHGDEVLLTLGDVQMDGVDQPTRASQDAETDHGKIIAINPDDGRARHFATGLRNSQGMAVTASGAVFVTDHGAKGGDELNRIEEGENYGWPLVTYGANYGAFNWPLAEKQGRHDDYTKPLFAWLPSPASSALISLNDAIPQWSGDLLMGSLKDQSLYRIRIDGDVARYAERIYIGQRIRDIAQFDDGTIALWTDTEEIVFLSALHEQVTTLAANAPDVMARCMECHSLSGVSDGPAPTLLPGQFDAEHLRAFLVDPGETAMPETAFPQADQIPEIVKFLAR